MDNGYKLQRHLCWAVMLGALASPCWADSEVEPNQPIGQAQVLAITQAAGQTSGGATVDAVMGVLSGPAVADLDFYAFDGHEGDVVTVDIDGGMGGVRSVDTIVGIFGPAPAYTLLRYNDDAGYPLDPGSTSPYDARITSFRLPATGRYTIGVSSYPRRLYTGGVTYSSTTGANANGDYKLVVSGVTVPVLQINIDVKPGDNSDPAPINPKAKGKIPVALLGSKDFSPVDVNTATLRFGHSGDEASFVRCGDREDLNGDGYPDMVCHFDNRAAGFLDTDDEAVLKGRLLDGRAFEGRGWLKMVPVKAIYQ